MNKLLGFQIKQYDQNIVAGCNCKSTKNTIYVHSLLQSHINIHMDELNVKVPLILSHIIVKVKKRIISHQNRPKWLKMSFREAKIQPLRNHQKKH